MTATNMCSNFDGFRGRPPLKVFFFFKNTFLKLCILLECEYNELQLVYESAPLRQANKSYSSLHRAVFKTKLTEGNPSRIVSSLSSLLVWLSNQK